MLLLTVLYTVVFLSVDDSIVRFNDMLSNIGLQLYSADAKAEERLYTTEISTSPLPAAATVFVVRYFGPFRISLKESC